MFYKRPRQQSQRERWTALIDMMENEGPFTTREEIMIAMKETGRWDYGMNQTTLGQDLYACGIGKFNGVWVRVPPDEDEELKDIFGSRLRIAAEEVFMERGMIIVNTNYGAGYWVASMLKELRDDRIVSLNMSVDSFWILPKEGKEKEVYEWVLDLWRLPPGRSYTAWKRSTE